MIVADGVVFGGNIPRLDFLVELGSYDPEMPCLFKVGAANAKENQLGDDGRVQDSLRVVSWSEDRETVFRPPAKVHLI